jgi:hypothetical protein
VGGIGLALDPSPSANFVGVRREELKNLLDQEISPGLFYLVAPFPNLNVKKCRKEVSI